MKKDGDLIYFLRLSMNHSLKSYATKPLVTDTCSKNIHPNVL